MSGSIEVALQADALVELFGDLLTTEEKHKITALPPCSVSSAVKLQAAVGINRAKKLLKDSKLHLEVDLNGLRRCVYKTCDVRCTSYNSIPVCQKHFNEATMISPSAFKNVALRNAYTRHLSNPRKLQADSELAVLRTMLELLLGKAGENGNLPIEHIAAISALSEKITVVLDRMHKMNEITPEKIEMMMEKVVDIISEYVHPDKLKECAEKIGTIGTSLPNCEIQYLPGDTVQMVGEDGAMRDTQVTTVAKRALIESAMMMEIENAGG
jgi:hypothetical protein